MTPDQLLSRFSNLRILRNADQRAPHKPLLILVALAEWVRGRHAVRFADIVEPLTNLLQSFGPPRRKHRPQDPFWRLQNDGVWEVSGSDPPEVGSDGTPSIGELLRVDATGQFTSDLRSAFLADPSLITALAQYVLQTHFPDSIHPDILDTVGLDLAEPRAAGGRRDPDFRKRVLTAYQHRCAVCGFQLLLSGIPAALEAAHIKWHQASGPPIVPNGLALCVLHHKVFDLGAFTLTRELIVLVSDQATGLAGFTEHLLSYHGRELLKPVHPQDLPCPDFIDWHKDEVFRGVPRPF